MSLEERRMIKTKRFIFKETQAGPVSDKIMKQIRHIVKVIVAGRGEGRRIFVIEKAMFRIGQEMMRTITLRSKRLHPRHVVEVHAVVAAMGRAKRIG